MSIKNFFKRLFRRLAVLFVTLWARKAFADGVSMAEERWRKTAPERRRTIYLVEDPFRPGHLVTYDKDEFKAGKRAFGVHARLLTMNTLRRESFYHTADRYGGNSLSAHEKEIRRRAFIKDRLRMAKLI